MMISGFLVKVCFWVGVYTIIKKIITFINTINENNNKGN